MKEILFTVEETGNLIYQTNNLVVEGENNITKIIVLFPEKYILWSKSILFETNEKVATQGGYTDCCEFILDESCQFILPSALISAYIKSVAFSARNQSTVFKTRKLPFPMTEISIIPNSSSVNPLPTGIKFSGSDYITVYDNLNASMRNVSLELRQPLPQAVVENLEEDITALRTADQNHLLSADPHPQYSTIQNLDARLTDYYSKSQTISLLSNKVDKQPGKSLIADSEIQKLAETDFDSKADLVEGRIPINQLPADMAFNRLLAEYTHNSNKEIYIDSVDTATGTFYSSGHGLSNNDTVWATLNSDAGGIYPQSVFPGNLTMQTGGYYVINSTPDSFQLSVTVNGPVYSITDNEAMDLTKWHFERLRGYTPIDISLPEEQKKVKVVMQGKSLQHAYVYTLPQSLFYDDKWYRNGNIGYPHFEQHGSVWERYIIDIDYSGHLTMWGSGACIQYSTAGANIFGTKNSLLTRHQNADISFDYINFKFLTPANGYNIKIYSNEI